MRATYDKQAVIRDIAEKILTPEEISLKYGISVGNVYTIKSAANRRGKSFEERAEDEAGVLTPELRKRIKDMREEELTTTEIATILRAEGLSVTREEVGMVMARAAERYVRRESPQQNGGKRVDSVWRKGA